MSSILPAIHVALLDDHKLFRQGITYILQRLPYVASIAEAATFAELQTLMKQQQPDVLLLDLQMPGVDGIEVTKRVLQEHPDLKIIVLSMHDAEHFIVHMFKLGVRSYLPKDVDQEQLGQAIETVLTQGNYFTDSVSKAMVRGLQLTSRHKPSFVAPTIVLTPREAEVLELMCQGYTTNEISQRLFISGRTVEGHRQNLLDKTGTHNPVTLALYAVKHGLLANPTNGSTLPT